MRVVLNQRGKKYNHEKLSKGEYPIEFRRHSYGRSSKFVWMGDKTTKIEYHIMTQSICL